MLAIEPPKLDNYFSFLYLNIILYIFSLNIGKITSIESPITNQKIVHTPT